MMRLRRFVRMGLLKNLRNGKGILFAGLIALVCLLLSANDISEMKDSAQSITYYFTRVFGTSYWNPLMHMLAAYVPLCDFCQEWQNGYWKSIETRCGKRAYVTGRIVVHLLQTVLIMALGQLLFLTVLFIAGALFQRPVIAEGDTWKQMLNHPYLYLLLRVMVFSLSSGFWGMTALLVASVQMDLFAAVGVPLALYLALNYIMYRLPFGISLGGIELMLAVGGVLYNVLLALVVFGLLIGILACLVTELLRKRIENEIHS